MVKIYSIYDSKLEAFLQPFFAPTDGVALRSFADGAADAGSNFYKHAEDYELFCIGIFDDEFGKISPLEANKALGNALTMKEMGERI